MIIHLDADAFFASVEQAADPKLRGRPVAVGGGRRGVIASASYEARKLGVFTPMPTARARRLCPQLVVLPGDFEKYERFSRFMFSYAYDFTPMVEVCSIDEGYFDLRMDARRPAREVAEALRRAIGQSLKIPVSEGIAGNKLVAQVASKLKKPACFLEVPAGGERAFLAPLPNRWLPGVGPKLGGVLDAAGLRTIERIAGVSPEQLALFAGGLAPELCRFARGEDERPVIPEPPEAKSLGKQETFEEDVTDEAFILARLRRMADGLAAELRAEGKSFRTVSLKIRYNDRAEESRSHSFSEPTDLEDDLYAIFPRLLREAWSRRVSLRLAGISLSRFYATPGAELELNDAGAANRPARRRLAAVIDALRREGHDRILRGHDLWLRSRGGRPRREVLPPPRGGPAVEPGLPSSSVAVAEAPAAYGTAPGGRPCPVRRLQPYAALNVRSHYNFLDSLLSPAAAVERAAAYGLPAVALTDPNLHGLPAFLAAARAAGVRPIVGAELRVAAPADNPAAGGRRLAYVESRRGYGNLCRLLSLERITPADLADHREGLLLLPPDDPAGPVLPEVRYLDPKDRRGYDIVQSIRTLTLLAQPHPEKRLGGGFAFLSPAEVERRWGGAPDRIRATLAVAERCTWVPEFEGLQFPAWQPPDGSTPREFLRRLVLEGLARHYPDAGEAVRGQVEAELRTIAEVGYEEYFLVVWDILQECRRRGIEWITRGSAGDSLVCRCLEFSDFCPLRFELYFRRFLNRDRMARHKLPDIDLDFAHDRKDEVVDLIFEKYGREHAAVVGGFSTFRGRSAVAEIAKVLGVAEFEIRRFTERLPYATGAAGLRRAISESPDCRDLPVEDEPYATALALADLLDGFPRHRKMHPCGVVLSRVPIRQITPVFTCAKGYPATHFDMDAVEDAGLVKLDILAQGGLAVMRDTVEMVRERHGITPDLKALKPWNDPEVWRLIASGGARGVHHIESPAMTSLVRMCQADTIDTLIAIVSVIRPGAANTMRKVTFSRRCQGLEAPEYPHPSLEPVLRTTHGVMAYEEHVLQICEAFAGIEPGRSDVLRRALVKLRDDIVADFKKTFYTAAAGRGRTREETDRVWALLEGFRGYAFCRAHSTAYGIEAFEAAYLKHYYTPEFLAGVLTHGKGFYSRLVYTLEARRLGIGLVHPCVNRPRDGFYPEEAAGGGGVVLRVPLERIGGLSEGLLARWRAERAKGSFASPRDFYFRCAPGAEEMRLLVRAGALDGFGQPRTALCWELHRLAHWPRGSRQGLLFTGGGEVVAPPPGELEEPSLAERLRDEMELFGFTISAHPLALYPEVDWTGYPRVAELGGLAGRRVTVCGLVVETRIHHQADGEPMKFITLCDHSGMLEMELFATVYRRFGVLTVRHPVLEATGVVDAFENGRGYTLRVERVAPPRRRPAAS
ncbi:MAG: DNA polymerase III subunit alpha [Puniceicoccaceae bacterium]|nr:MAG: DNA polymerase III subunit alpha [Puniceicoccaceae bacterium]